MIGCKYESACHFEKNLCTNYFTVSSIVAIFHIDPASNRINLIDGVTVSVLGSDMIVGVGVSVR